MSAIRTFCLQPPTDAGSSDMVRAGCHGSSMFQNGVQAGQQAAAFRKSRAAIYSAIHSAIYSAIHSDGLPIWRNYKVYRIANGDGREARMAMIGMMEREQVQKPDEFEALLPWLATGKLNAGDERRVKAAISQNPALARDYAAVEEEYNELVLLNESLGAPSPRAMHHLFAMIDAEQSLRSPAGQITPAARGPDEGVMTRAIAVLSSSRVLGWAAGFGLMVLLVQAIIIGTKIL